MFAYGGTENPEMQGIIADTSAIPGMTHYLYDLDQNLISEHMSNAFLLREYIYLPLGEAVIPSGAERSRGISYRAMEQRVARGEYQHHRAALHPDRPSARAC